MFSWPQTNHTEQGADKFAFLLHYVAWFWEQFTSGMSQAADCLPLLKLSG